jgi:hypothetical protein
MTRNDTLLWLYHQSLKPEIQQELLQEMFNTPEALQSTAINTDDLLFSFQKQHQGDQTHKNPQKLKQIEYWQNSQPAQGTSNQGWDPNAMELDQLLAECQSWVWSEVRMLGLGLAYMVPHHFYR